jgi:hypothetical protein
MFCVAQSLRDPPNVEGTNLRLLVLNQSRTLALGHPDGSSSRHLALSHVRHRASTVCGMVLPSGAAKYGRVLTDKYATVK